MMAGFAAVVTLAVLIVRAAAEGRPATPADVISALAVGLVIGAAGAVVPFLMMRRMPHHAELQFQVGPSRAGERESIRFQTFDDGARAVLTRAQEEARRLGHNYMGTEHLLLGLLGDPASVATRALERLGVAIGPARTAVEFIIGRGTEQVSGEMGLTPRSKRVIELAIDEARRLGDDFVGSEHLLLGLVREGEGIAAGVLETFGVTDADRVRAEVLRYRGT